MLTFSKQSLIDTQVILNGSPFAWIQKQSGVLVSYHIKFKSGHFMTSRYMSEAKEICREFARIEAR